MSDVELNGSDESDSDEIERANAAAKHKAKEACARAKKPKVSEVEFDSDDESAPKPPAQGDAALAVPPTNLREKDEEEDDDDDKDDEDEEDDFKRQLRLERQEQLAMLNKEKKTKKDPDGTEYEWDPVAKGWFPKIPDQQFINYHQSYGVATQAAGTSTASNQEQPKLLPDTFYLYNGAFYTFDFANNKWTPAACSVYAYVDYMTGIAYKWDEKENKWAATTAVGGGAAPLPDDVKQQETAATAATTTATSASKDATKSEKKKKEGWVQVDDEKNTNVYVSGLPLDISDDEFEEMMSKYGIIMKDPVTFKLKIKLYRDEANEVKGDGRCCYLMPESVKLCLQLLDGSMQKGHQIKVEKAKFEMKGSFDATKAANHQAAGKNKPTMKKSKEKKLLEKQRQRLLDWEERPDIVREKHEKVVVIKNIFSPSDAKKDPKFLEKLKEDIKTELEPYGVIKKILIHAHNPEGIVTVSFKEVEMADTCCQYLNNRIWKNGRAISCETWDGETKYEVEESEEDRQKRIDEWHKFLESEDD